MIGIIGFGRFSALMTRYLSADFKIKIATRKDRSKQISDLGAEQVSLETVCRQPRIILSVPISAMEDMLGKIAPLIAPDAMVVDVCSVKIHPVRWMREQLPETVSILATHPMFGPDSAADALEGKKIVLCPERLDRGRYETVRGYLVSKGLTVIETTPEEHDRQIASSLSLTHFVGRSLAAFGAAPIEIDTEGYKRLLRILDVTQNDTWELFMDMHRYNPYAKGIRKEFMDAVGKIDDLLDGF